MTTITYTLPNFPQLNQLHEVPGDGFPDANAGWACVPTSLADGLRFLTGRDRGTDGTPFDGDGLRDKVYGTAYRGGQAASAYVDYCRSQGVALVAFNGTPAALVARIHAALVAGHPVIATIPSEWGIPRDQQPAGHTTHVVCFCGYGPSALRASNPWIAAPGVWHDGDDQYWIDRLCDNQVWLMEREERVIPMAFSTQPDGTGKDAKGHTCGAGMMAYIAAHGIVADGRRSETYLGGLGPVKAFLTLSDGEVLTWDGANVGTDAASVVEGLYAQLQAALNAAQHPISPQAQAALQIVAALKKLESILP